MSFREAHEVVGLSVIYGIKHNKELAKFSLDELQQFSKQIDDDGFKVLTLESSIAARNHIGGTAPKQVKLAIKVARNDLSNCNHN